MMSHSTIRVSLEKEDEVTVVASSAGDEVTSHSESGHTFQRPLDTEDILVIPRIWTKKAYQLLLQYHAIPRPWHFEGRWGSRTHKIDEDRMGFPIISRRSLEEKAAEHPAIQELLAVEGVSILTDRPFVASRRARDPVFYDATIHPERKRSKNYQITQNTPEIVSQVFPRDIEKEPPRFTYAELFAGIGGFGVALEALGGRCVFVSELEEHCRETYMANFDTPRQHIYGDITQVKDSEFPKPGALDLLVGGFPCQPFSNMSQTQPGMKCEKGRGLLFQEIVRVLKCSRPKAFLLENVPGLHGMEETFQHILRSFEDSGYTVSAEVCSSRGLTATSRKRLFFVGLRHDLIQTDEMQGKGSFQFPFVPDLQLKAENIMDYDELPSEELEILRLNDDTMDRLVNSGRWRPHSLAWPNRPCDTITSHYGNAVGRGESQLNPSRAPHHPRRFSIRECARLMGFPNSYRLVPQKSTQGDMAYRKLYYRMFGNAVCPPLIAALAGAVLDHCQIRDEEKTIDWTDKGISTAKALAMAATRLEPVSLPMGCLVFNGDR